MPKPSTAPLCLGLLLALLATTPAAAQGTPSPRVLLDAALEAHGGRDRLIALPALAFRQETTSEVPGQGYRPGEPAEVPISKEYLLDLAGERGSMVQQFQFPGGYRFRNQTVFEGGSGWVIDVIRGRSGTDVRRYGAEAAAGGWAELNRALPPLALRQAALHGDSLTYEGLQMHGGERRHAVSYVTAGRAVTLHLDPEHHRLEALTLRTARGPLVTSFHDYAEHGGLLLPGTLVVRQGESEGTHRVTGFDLAPDLGGRFDLPAGYADAPEETVAPAAVRLADRVHLLTGLPGDYRSVVAEQDDHVLLLEAPASPAHARAIGDLLAEIAPGKPVRRVLVSHHHSDHVGGLAPFLSQGATAVVGPGGDALVRSLASEGEPAVEVVTDRRSFGAGPGRVEAYAVETDHAETMLMFYLPEAGVLFQGDLFLLPYRGAPAASPGAFRDFARALEARGLTPERIVSVHGGRDATMDDLRRVTRLGE